MAAEHELDPARHFRLLGQLEQRRERARVELLTAEVEQDAFRFEREPLEALGVRREEGFDRAALERLRAFAQRLPGSGAWTVGLVRHAYRVPQVCTTAPRTHRNK